MIRYEAYKLIHISGVLLLIFSLGGLWLPPADVYPQDRNQVKGPGQVVGRVSVAGRFEIPEPLKVNKNRDFCGSEVPNQTFLVGPDGGLQNVIVTIRGPRRDPKGSQLSQIVLDNKSCAFVPHVQVASPGSEILLLNSDPILHNVHARLGAETLFNVGLPQWRTVKKRLDREGLIRIHCDVLHTWMSAYILVTSTPYFAVTDRNGEFAIEGIPAGSYEINIWHEKLGNQSRKMTLKADRTLSLDVVYRASE
jgi:plastocyanin